MMFNEFKEFNHDIVPKIKHKTIIISDLNELANVFSENPIMVPKPGSGLKPQYEMLNYKNDEVIHYKLESSNHETELDISYLYIQFLQTGKIAGFVAGTSNAHKIPIPVYNIEQSNVNGMNQIVSVVKLKNGHKALVADDKTIIEGVEI